MSKAKVIIPAEKLALYDDLIASQPDIDRKGKNNPYTSVNGHMFSFLDKTGVMALRLSKEDREAFMKKHNTELMISYNTVMKEYVRIPDDLLANKRAMKKYLKMSFEYVASLKPKPTTRKKKK